MSTALMLHYALSPHMTIIICIGILENIFSLSLSLDYQMPQSAEVIDFIIAHTHTHIIMMQW